MKKYIFVPFNYKKSFMIIIIKDLRSKTLL